MALPVNPDDPDSGSGGSTTPSDPNVYGTLVFSQPVDKEEDDSALRVICYLNCAAVDDLRFTSYVFVDGTIVQVGTTNQIFDNQNSDAQGTMTVVAYANGYGAGRRTVELRVKNRDAKGLRVLAGSIIEVTELKRAAR